jgi:hypothetical protein
VRIVDESGEDYLYHKDYFVFVDFPSGVKKKILALQGCRQNEALLTQIGSPD